MKTKLSHSAINMYKDCSLCFFLHYNKGIRPIRGKSALLFGGALDSALNHMLKTRNLNEAYNVFYAEWNKVDRDLTDFSKSDVDQDLIDIYGGEENPCPAWISLQHKANLFLQAYYKDVLPKIKKVLVVQEPVSIKNSEGDEITGFLDLIAEWEDGKTYLLDNKTTSAKYTENSAKESPQLALYHYIMKDEYKLDGVGYIVMNKKINKNIVKRCKECFEIGYGSFRTCNATYSKDGSLSAAKRCNGEFSVTMNPSVDVQIILSKLNEGLEEKTIEEFDKINTLISNGIFDKKHNPNGKYGPCTYSTYYEGNPNFTKKEVK